MFCSILIILVGKFHEKCLEEFFTMVKVAQWYSLDSQFYSTLKLTLIHMPFSESRQQKTIMLFWQNLIMDTKIYAHPMLARLAANKKLYWIKDATTTDPFYMRYSTPLDFHMRTNGLIQGTTLKVSKNGRQYFKKKDRKCYM